MSTQGSGYTGPKLLNRAKRFSPDQPSSPPATTKESANAAPVATTDEAERPNPVKLKGSDHPFG